MHADTAALVSGRKDDQTKAPWHLLPLGPVAEVVRVLAFGASKYGPDNWQQLEQPEARYFSATLRHLVAWRQGERLDPESGLPHLAHAACSLLFLLWFELRGGS